MRFEMSSPWRAHVIKQGYLFEDYAQVYEPVSPAGDAPKITDPALYRTQNSDTAFLTDRFFLETMSAHKDTNWFAHLTLYPTTSTFRGTGALQHDVQPSKPSPANGP